MKAATIIILIATVFFSCSDPSEEIKPIIEIDPHANDGIWGAYKTTISFTVNGDEFTDIIPSPLMDISENNSKVIFFGDSVKIQVRVISGNGSPANWDWVMKWEPGLHEAPGYMTLVKEDNTTWMETKSEYLFYKLN